MSGEGKGICNCLQAVIRGGVLPHKAEETMALGEAPGPAFTAQQSTLELHSPKKFFTHFGSQIFW